MTHIEINPKIKSKTTFNVPVLFGAPQPEKKKLFSYTIFDKKIAKEIRFASSEVYIYKFDKNNFIKEITVYNSDNTIKSKTKFEFTSKEEGVIKFLDWTPGGRTANKATLKYSSDKGCWKLTFHRVSTFIGYKKYGLYTTNELGDFSEEKYYDGYKDVLEKYLVNNYEYFENSLDNIARNILKNGWIMSKEELDYIKNKNR